jgi:hypothetical protein
LLLAALAAVADTAGVVEDVTTDELRAFAGLPDRSYRRARLQLLADAEAQLEDAGGGRAKTHRWRIRDPRLIEQEPPTATTARPSQNTDCLRPDAPARAGEQHGRRDASIATSAAAETRPAGEGSGLNPGQSRTVPSRNPSQNRTVPRGNPGQIRTGSAKTRAKAGPLRAKTPAETPAKTPALNARAGREPQNLRTAPPHPPGGGLTPATIEVQEHYLSNGGRRRRRTLLVDLEQVRGRLQPPTRVDRDDWEQARAVLMGAVSESVYAIWFEPLQLVAVDQAGTLIVAGDAGLCGWVHSRFGAVLAQFAERIGRQLRVADEVEQRALALRPEDVQFNHQEVS